jgi:hypothetical protein
VFLAAQAKTSSHGPWAVTRNDDGPPVQREAAYVTVNQPAATWLRGDAFPVCGMTLAVLLVFLVVVPAVWSHQAERREAAFRVLDRILRFPRWR